MSLQCLRLHLDGITAGDYLSWVRDPEPPGPGISLASITVRADPLGETITAALFWSQVPPAPRTAAVAAGLPLTPEVSALETCTVTTSPPGAGHRHPRRGRGLGRPERSRS